MARPKKNELPDLTQAHDLTAGVIDRLQCPPEKKQAFLRDTKSPSLRVRVTPPSTKNPGGVKAFVFESKLHRKTLRTVIGDVRAWTIEDARIEANRLRVLVDKGIDPRELDRQKEAEAAEKQAQEAARAVTFGEAWAAYCKDRHDSWGERTRTTHVEMVHLGGEPRKRWKGKLTIPAPLAYFVPMRLADVDRKLVQTWAAEEVKQRPTHARHAVRMMKAFFNWCTDEEEDHGHASVVSPVNPAAGKKLKNRIGSDRKRKDVLAREQLPAWFENVLAIPNPVVSAYLQSVLLTGGRREELTTLRWENVDLVWRKMTVRDKMNGERELPLTPYVRQLIMDLPRVNEWVFPSIRVISQDEKHLRRRQRYNQLHGKPAPVGGVVVLSASGHIEEPGGAHTHACAAAGITLTLHGLRRSFATLSQWEDAHMAGGVSAQIQGHAPQGVREGHYIVRPIDMLRYQHDRFEAWVLKHAGIEFTPPENAQQLRLVAHN